MGSSALIRCDIAIVGGGASGYFTAANLKLGGVGTSCVLFEGSQKALAKVRISGGGRCNVTHHQFDVARLVEHYPRGGRELRGPFSRFQPRDMIAWLRQQGVQTKVEPDGRVFPVSNDSEDIVRCLQQACNAAGVDTKFGYRITGAARDRFAGSENSGFVLDFQNGSQCRCRMLVMATGSHLSGLQVAASFGHTVVSPVPSLFTLNIEDARLKDLAGISFDRVRLMMKVGNTRFEQLGPVLITHWGLSGPAILKLSAWAARELAELHYEGELEVDFAPDMTLSQAEDIFQQMKRTHGSKQIENAPISFFARRYWQQLIQIHGLNGKKMAQLSRAELSSLVSELKRAVFRFRGKSTHKDEFVTAGGVDTREIDMKSMQSKIVPGLYFTGEILNIDGVTGGFNFQNAWTSGFLCATDLNQHEHATNGDSSP